MTFTDLEVEPDDVLRRMRVDGRQNTSVLLLQLLTKTHTHKYIQKHRSKQTTLGNGRFPAETKTFPWHFRRLDSHYVKRFRIRICHHPLLLCFYCYYTLLSTPVHVLYEALAKCCRLID